MPNLKCSISELLFLVNLTLPQRPEDLHLSFDSFRAKLCKGLLMMRGSWAIKSNIPH